MKDLLTSKSLEQGAGFSNASAVKGERPLLIPDFVRLPKGVYNSYDETSDEVLASNFALNSQIVVRTKKKPSLDQLSLAQWVSASCRILLHIITVRLD